MAERKLEVSVIGDARSLERALGRAGQVSEGFGHKLGHVVKIGAEAAAAGVVVAGAALVDFAHKAAEEQAVQARLHATLKAAGIAWKSHAEAIEHAVKAQETLSGFSKDQLTASFAQLARTTGSVSGATRDMALATNVARGQGISLEAATKLVTKAELGKVGALTRSGIEAKAVTSHMDALKASHVKVTEAMKEAAKAADALATKHELIATLQEKFRGQAEAYGQTTAGAMDRFKNATHDLEVSLGTALLPAITKIVTVVARWVEKLEASQTLHHAITAAVHALGTAFRTAGEVISAVSGFVSKHQTLVETLAGTIAGLVVGITAWAVVTKAIAAANAIATGAQTLLNAALDANPIGIVVVAVAALAGGLVILYEKSATVRRIVNEVGAAFETVWPKIESVAKTVIGAVVAQVERIAKVVKDVFTLIGDLVHGRWSKIWADVKQLVVHGVDASLGYLKGVPGLFLAAAEKIGQLVLKGLELYYIKLPELILKWMGKALKALVGLGDDALSYAGKIGKDIIDGILHGLGGLYGKLKHKLEHDLKGVLSSLNPFSPVSHGGEKYIGKPLAEGTIQGWIVGSQPLPAAINKTIRHAVDQARRVVASERGAFSAAWSNLTADAVKAFDAQTTQLMNQVQAKFAAAKSKLDRQTQAALAGLDAQGQQLTPEEQKVQDEQDAHDAAARQQAIQDAQAQLGQAQAGGDAQQILQAQRALDDAKYQEQLAADQKSAAASRKAEDDKIAAEKAGVEAKAKAKKARLEKEQKEEEQHLREQRSLEKLRMEQQLKDLKTQLEKQGASHKQAQEKIIALLKGYGITYRNSGKLLGQMFAQGLLDAEGDVARAANKIAQTAANYLALRSPAKLGPLSKVDTWWKPLPGMLVGALDTRSVDGAVARVAGGALGGSGLGVSTGGFGGGVTIINHIEISGPVFGDDKRRIAEEMARDITLAQRNYQRLGGPSPAG